MHKIRANRLFLLFLIPATTFLLAFQTYFSGNSETLFRQYPTALTQVNLDSVIRYRTYYPFIRYEKNYVEWYDSSAIESFYTKVGQTSVRKLKVLQIGDSHIQADLCSGYVRERLQEILGYGGRGLVFPYRVAGTSAAYDYFSSYHGSWESCKSIQRDAKFDMGIIGATAFTKDSAASFRLAFRDGFVRSEFNVLKIYCKQDTGSFDVKIKVGSGNNPIYVDCNDTNNKRPYIQIQLPQGSDTIEVSMVKTEKNQSFFECYGMLIESSENSGVLYNTSGINGAGYVSLLRQKLFPAQLAELNPDLVVIDMGANDFFAGAFNQAAMKQNLEHIIDIIRASAPHANILISSAQDIYFRRKIDVAGCNDFIEMIKTVAKERNCAYYDYYHVSGGRYSMNNWYKSGLARNDKVHLSAAGYYIRGELFLNALLNSYNVWQKNHNASLAVENFVIDTAQLKQYFPEKINFKKAPTQTTNTAYNQESQAPEMKNAIYYRIKAGDNLGSIAEKFGVKVSQLQYWNAMSGTKIIAGETLIIYSGSVKPNQTNTPLNVQSKPLQNTNPATIPQTNRTVNHRRTYKVKAGDNLWLIARKYNITVDQIKKCNNLKTDHLSIGQILQIP